MTEIELQSINSDLRKLYNLFYGYDLSERDKEQVQERITILEAMKERAEYIQMAAED